MEPDVLAELIEAAERYYDSTFDLNDAENEWRKEHQRDSDPHRIAHVECRLASQKGETIRAAGALLRAVENYRAFREAKAEDDGG
jgi:hypothetical protein